jgi:hypothetical protein
VIFVLLDPVVPLEEYVTLPEPDPPNAPSGIVYVWVCPGSVTVDVAL